MSFILRNILASKFSWRFRGNRIEKWQIAQNGNDQRKFQKSSSILDLVLSHTGGPKSERVEKNRGFIQQLRWLPISLIRAMLRAATRKSMQDASEQRDFWVAYSNELIARLRKEDLISRYLVAIDFDAASHGSPHDLAGWPGRTLILECDNDPIAEAPDRQALKELHAQAIVHTFHGTGHVASIARVDEYVKVIKDFLQ